MHWFFAVVGVAFVAFAILSTVRIINKGERRAKRAALALIVVLVGYPLSFGPACWWLSNPQILAPDPDYSEIRRGPLA